jgi:hypothetical protein
MGVQQEERHCTISIAEHRFVNASGWGHLAYDRMASFLATYGSPEALKVAQDLDAKVGALLAAAAGRTERPCWC